MTPRSRKKKAELLEELSAQDKEMEALRTEIKEANQLVETSLSELQTHLETILDSSEDTSSRETNASDSPPTYRSARVVAASALGLAVFVVVMCFVLVTGDSASSPFNKSNTVLAPQQKGAAIGTADKSHTVVVYGNLTSAEMREAYQDVLKPLFAQVSHNKLKIAFHPLPGSSERSQAAAATALKAASEDRLWDFLAVYLQHPNAKHLLNKAATVAHLETGWHKMLFNKHYDRALRYNKKYAAEKIVDADGLIIIEGNSFSLVTSLPQIQEALRKAAEH
jgi:hypothetical protein